MIESVYVHIPFCKKKCLYCDFNSFDNKQEKIEEYMNALYKECTKFSFSSLKTIYIGGGTPSFIEADYIVKLLEILPKAEEITIEMNPCTVTLEKLKKYKNAGVNRVSMGLQTTNDNILKKIGRAHSFSEFENAYKLVKKSGFENINIDLMFGLPTQTLKDLEESVDYLIKLNPKHISCYSLILHSDIFKELPNEEEEREMYYYTKNKLGEAGFMHYEISNFSKEGFESKHNLAYWNQKEYVGLGAGASSYVDKTRYTNISDLEKYITCINEKSDVRIIEENQTNEEKLREYIILQLRLIDGLHIEKTNKAFNTNIMKKFEKEIHKLISQNLLQIEDGRLKLTEKGLDFANVVWREFI